MTSAVEPADESKAKGGTRHAAWRLHAHFDLDKYVPSRMDLTNGRRPDKGTLTMAYWYISGIASESEWLAPGETGQPWHEAPGQRTALEKTRLLNREDACNLQASALMLRAA